MQVILNNTGSLEKADLYRVVDKTLNRSLFANEGTYSWSIEIFFVTLVFILQYHRRIVPKKRFFYRFQTAKKPFFHTPSSNFHISSPEYLEALKLYAGPLWAGGTSVQVGFISRVP